MRTERLPHYFKLALYVFLACVSSSFAQAFQASRISGIVKDPSGALITAATVVLEARDIHKETTTNANGEFSFVDIQPGSYKLSIHQSGFEVRVLNVSLRNAPVRLTVKMEIARVFENVDVSSANGAGLDADNGAGTRTLSTDAISRLPDDPDAMNEELQTLATSSGGAPGEAMITVDGFASVSRLPPKSSISEIRINPDLFSAEYARPPYQGGRIEVFTKSAANSVHGELFFEDNNSILNARDPLASTRPDSQRKRYGFALSTPIVKSTTGLFLNLERRDIDKFVVINAAVLDPQLQPVPLIENVASPEQLWIGVARVDWKVGKTHSLLFSYSANRNSFQNRGVGGLTLSEAGISGQVFDHEVHFSDMAFLNASVLNEFRVGLFLTQMSQFPSSTAPGITVAGAFTGGGGTSQFLGRDRKALELNNALSIVRKKHSFKGGIQIFGEQISENVTGGFNGQTVFAGGEAPVLDSAGHPVLGPNGVVLETISGLEQYRRSLLGLPGGTATLQSITTGNPALSLTQWQFAAYAQDQWKVSAPLTASFGVRLAGQTAPFLPLTVAPRIGIAYAFGKERKWVIRGRAGLFFDHIDSALVLEAKRLDGVHQEQNNTFFVPVLNAPPVSVPVETVRQLGDLSMPVSLQTQVGVEHAFPHGWKVQGNLYWTAGVHSIHSRNINAPIVTDTTANPLLAPRPLNEDINILQFESTGHIQGPVTFFGLEQSQYNHFTFFLGYLWFHFRTDADTPLVFPQSSFSQSGEFVRPSWGAPQRVFVRGTVDLPWKFKSAIQFDAVAGAPFDVTTGRDNNGDGNFNDRPDFGNSAGSVQTALGPLDPNAINGNLPRNFGTMPPTVLLHVRLSRSFSVGPNKPEQSGQTITFSVTGDNLTNHTNVTTVTGIVLSPLFGRPAATKPPRQIELGIRYAF
jgi:hypothetical protein